MGDLQINHLAVFAAAISNMAVGAIWFSPALFYESWKKEARITDSDVENANMGRTYSLGFLFALIIAYNLAAFLGDAGTTASWGATAGFLAGFGFAAAMFAAVATFEQRSLKYVLINGGYITVCMTIMGFIIGLWR